MENTKNALSQGDIRKIWAESYDVEMGRFLLMPIEELNCKSCPKNHGTDLQSKRTILVAVKRFKNKMRVYICLYVVGWIERLFVGSNAPYSSQIVDGCLAIKEGLEHGSSY